MNPRTLFALFGVLIVVAAVIVYSSDSWARGEAAPLNLVLTKGSKFRQEYTTRQTVTQVLNGASQSSGDETSWGQSFTVQEVHADGSATVRFDFEWLRIQMTGMAEILYDSRLGASPHPPLWAMAALVGSGLDVHLSPTGTITEVEGGDVILQDILGRKDRPEGIPDEMVERAVKSKLGHDVIKSMLEDVLAIYPESPVRLGDHWRRTASVPGPIPLEANHRWELIERDPALRVRLRSTIPRSSNTLELGPEMRLTYELSGTRSGEIELDPETHWIRSSTSTQKLRGNALSGNGLSIPIEVSAEISVKRVD